ncbi:MAG: hypothetical protein V3U78_07635 [Thiotrichaceae bacterium]
MASLLPIFFVAIFLLVVFISSFLAKIFKAKRHGFFWMLLPWVVAAIAVVVANVLQLDGLYALAIGLAAFMLTLKVINVMQFSSVATILIANIATIAVLFVGTLYGVNKSGENTSGFTANAVAFLPESKFYDLSFLERIEKEEDQGFVDTEEPIVDFSEKDLLPNRVAKKYHKNPSIYHVVNPRKAGSMRGAKFRLLKHDGKTIKGSIIGVEGNKLIVGKYIPQKGMIKAPILIDLIKKLEVLK